MHEPFLEFVRDRLEHDVVLIACGLPATNKTETTEIIARERGIDMLRTDLIRREVLAGEDIFDEKIAADMNRRTRVYDEMFARADRIAGEGRPVILDATFVTRALRRRAAEIAARHGRTFVIWQTRAPRDYSLAKIAKRSRESYESNALTAAAYDNNVRRFEPVDLDALKSELPALRVVHYVVDTGSDDPADWRVVSRDER